MNAARLDELRKGALNEPPPFGIVAMSNVLTLAVKYARELEERLERGGAEIIELHPTQRTGA